MAKFAYNIAKNSSTGHIYFELNSNYHCCISYKKKVDLWSKAKLANKWLINFKN